MRGSGLMTQVFLPRNVSCCSSRFSWDTCTTCYVGSTFIPARLSLYMSKYNASIIAAMTWHLLEEHMAIFDVEVRT